MTAEGGALPRLGRDGAQAPPVRAVHLGLGAFHRAHQAWYTHHADPGWGIAAFTGRSPAAAAPLAEQDGLFTLLTRDGEGERAEVVGSIASAHDGADVVAWTAHVAAPATALVTLTVTEAGYRARPGGGLDRDDPVVRADVGALRADPASVATTAPLRLAQGLAARWRADAGPIAVVSCDNLPDNASVARRVVLEACEALDQGLASWAAGSVSFVATVVDRITPATTAADLDAASRRVGRTDAAAVVTEPFSEWVLAGGFPAGRPAWEGAGARLVDDVTPFEQRKLWLLNGAHSLLAWAGPVLGHGTVADAIADPRCRAWVEQLWDDAVPSLSLPADELAAYRAALLERFANPALEHRLAQIAAGSTEKVRVRVLPVVAARRREGSVPLGECRAMAAWLLHLRGTGAPVADPGADRLRGLVGGPLPAAARALLVALGPDGGLADDGELVAAVADLAGEIAGQARSAPSAASPVEAPAGGAR